VHDSWQDATEVHAPELVKEYYARKWSAICMTKIKGTATSHSSVSPTANISHTNMSNGLSSPASTFSFQYPVTDHEETPTARTMNDYQYNDKVVLFGTAG
jgi:hypothetical protein